MIYSALDTIQHAKEGLISNEIDEYLCDVVFQIYIGQINRASETIYQHLRKTFLKEKKQLKISQLLNMIDSSDRSNEVRYFDIYIISIVLFCKGFNEGDRTYRDINSLEY